MFSYQDPVEEAINPEASIFLTSVTGDFDYDWKDETITFSGFVGGPLVATFTYVINSQPMNYVVRTQYNLSQTSRWMKNDVANLILLL